MLGSTWPPPRPANRPMRDNCRVVLTGAFCEQPPLSLIKSLEMSGCYIVDDDLILVSRWLLEDVPTEGDTIENLSGRSSSIPRKRRHKYEVDVAKKGSYLIDSVRKRKADGVIFAAPSFCDPALLDKPMMHLPDRRRSGSPTSHPVRREFEQMQPHPDHQSAPSPTPSELWSAS